MRVIAFILIVLSVIYGIIKYNTRTILPEFDDEFNQIVCIEEHL